MRSAAFAWTVRLVRRNPASSVPWNRIRTVQESELQRGREATANECHQHRPDRDAAGCESDCTSKYDGDSRTRVIVSPAETLCVRGRNRAGWRMRRLQTQTHARPPDEAAGERAG